MNKITAFAVLAITAFSAVSLADVPAACYAKAEAATEKFADSYYDEDGFSAYQCAPAPNNKAVICDVSASKGGGDAMDGYRVVLSENCARVYRVELTSEE